MSKKAWPRNGLVIVGLILVFAFGGDIICLRGRANVQTLKSLGGVTDYTAVPSGGLVQGANGVLYGAARETIFKIQPDGTGFSVVHVFGTSSNDARNIIGPLMLGVDQALYGSSGGGTNGQGVIFKLNEDGTGYKVLYSFGTAPQDGVSPQAPLVQGADGGLYGATYSGGPSNLGTIFRINPDGTGYRILHSFEGNPKDGANPGAGLIFGNDGALYGTTLSGGTSGTNKYFFPWGTVFKLNPDGTSFSLLHSFGGQADDGVTPEAPLLLGKDGALYGTTTGLYRGSSALRNVFRLNIDGTGYVVLHSFQNNPPSIPQSSLIQAADGNLYGITGGAQVQTTGTAFTLHPDGSGYSILHLFGSGIGQEQDPQGPLLQGSDGAFYGTTALGGANGSGTIFRMTIPPQVEPSFVVSIIPLVEGSFHISFEGVIGKTYRLQVSSDLSNWFPLGTVSNETGQVQFLDGNATRAPQRFYRAGISP